jgi:hypothetical protein
LALERVPAMGAGPDSSLAASARSQALRGDAAGLSPSLRVCRAAGPISSGRYCATGGRPRAASGCARRLRVLLTDHSCKAANPRVIRVRPRYCLHGCRELASRRLIPGGRADTSARSASLSYATAMASCMRFDSLSRIPAALSRARAACARHFSTSRLRGMAQSLPWAGCKGKSVPRAPITDRQGSRIPRYRSLRGTPAV